MKNWPYLPLLAAVALLAQGCAGTLAPVADPSADAGLRVYKDPATGAFVVPAPGTAADARVSTSSEGLVETRGTSAAGGMRLDLQGRFRSYAIATKDEQGRVTVRCEPNTPHSH